MKKTKIIITAFAVFASLLMLMTPTMARTTTERTDMDIIETTEQSLASLLEEVEEYNPYDDGPKVTSQGPAMVMIRASDGYVGGDTDNDGEGEWHSPDSFWGKVLLALAEAELTLTDFCMIVMAVALVIALSALAMSVILSNLSGFIAVLAAGCQGIGFAAIVALVIAFIVGALPGYLEELKNNDSSSGMTA